jgi:hypothetical protein
MMTVTNVENIITAGSIPQYLEVTIAGEVMTPRQAITATPYSILSRF